jgi:hypothetical protein
MIGDKDALQAGLGRLGSFLASAALVLALSFAISWPLWAFATAARHAFTLAIGVAAALFIAAIAAIAAFRRIRGGSRYRDSARRRGLRRSR